jgi:hypothetical protein
MAASLDVSEEIRQKVSAVALADLGAPHRPALLAIRRGLRRMVVRPVLLAASAWVAVTGVLVTVNQVQLTEAHERSVVAGQQLVAARRVLAQGTQKLAAARSLASQAARRVAQAKSGFKSANLQLLTLKRCVADLRNLGLAPQPGGARGGSLYNTTVSDCTKAFLLVKGMT